MALTSVLLIILLVEWPSIYAAPIVTNNADTPKSKAEEFFDAVSNGNLAGVTALLNGGMDVNSVDERQANYYTALHYAAERGNLEMIRLLLDRGAKVNPPENVGYSALMRAAEMGKREAVELLVRRGADVQMSDVSGKMTPLLYAVKGEQRSYDGMMANKGNAAAIVRLLIQKGANVNARDFLDQTALMYAALSGKLDLVRILVENGADFDAKSDDGETTALMMAADNELDDVVTFLVNRGANKTGCTHPICTSGTVL